MDLNEISNSDPFFRIAHRFCICRPEDKHLEQEVAVADGTYSVVYTYNYNKPDEVVSIIDVFPVSYENFNVDMIFFGTEEYVCQFQDSFHDNVIDIYIDSKYVHALSAEDGCVLRKKFTKKVKLKKHVLVNSVVDGNEITVPGFCNLDNEIYVMAFYYDGAENYLLLLNDV